MIGNHSLLLSRIIFTTLIVAGVATSLPLLCYRDGIYNDGKGSHNENCTYVILKVGSVQSKSGFASQWYSPSFFLSFKTRYPYLKLVLGLDPFDTYKSDLPEVIKTETGRERIIESAISIVNNMTYDGIDLVFRDEYVHETALVASGIRKAIGENGITLSGYFVRNISRDDFQHEDLSRIAEDLDFLTLECFDPIKSKPHAQLAAPLYSKTGNSVDRCIKWYQKMGVPPEKIVMAVQTYAVSHTLDDPDLNEPGSPAKNMGWPKYPMSREGLLYVDQITSSEWEFHRDEESSTPYAVNYLQWASFEDKISLAAKANYIKGKGLGGGALVTVYNRLDNVKTELPFTQIFSELLKE